MKHLLMALYRSPDQSKAVYLEPRHAGSLSRHISYTSDGLAYQAIIFLPC